MAAHEGVDAAAMIHALVIRVIPTALGKCHRAGNDAVRHLRKDMNHTAVGGHVYVVVVRNTARLGIGRVNPQLVCRRLLDNLIVRVG